MTIVPHTHPALTRVALAIPVEEIAQHSRLYDQIRRLMVHFNGACLSAPQVGVELQFFVTKFPRFGLCVNPRWRGLGSDRTSKPEGTLSRRGWHSYAARHRYIMAEFDDGAAVHHEFELSDMDARIFQHACDYLRGEPIWTS